MASTPQAPCLITGTTMTKLYIIYCSKSGKRSYEGEATNSMAAGIICDRVRRDGGSPLVEIMEVPGDALTW